MNYFINYLKNTIMKKKIFGGIAVVVFTCALAFGTVTNSNKVVLSAVTLANIEALANEEEGAVITCDKSCQGGGNCWDFHVDWLILTCKWSGMMIDYCRCW